MKKLVTTITLLTLGLNGCSVQKYGADVKTTFSKEWGKVSPDQRNKMINLEVFVLWFNLKSLNNVTNLLGSPDIDGVDEFGQERLGYNLGISSNGTDQITNSISFYHENRKVIRIELR